MVVDADAPAQLSMQLRLRSLIWAVPVRQVRVAVLRIMPVSTLSQYVEDLDCPLGIADDLS